MQFLGISPTELIFILVILFLVLGPQDLVKLGGTLGRTIRGVRESSAWRSISDATRQLRELPQNLARQAGVEELEQLGRELGTEMKEQRAKIEELDRQFVAWTRTAEPSSKKSPPTPLQSEGRKPGGE
jgi:Sec-independent protein translocase protein TatA